MFFFRRRASAPVVAAPEPVRWRVDTTVRKYRHVCIDEYRKRYGKDDGERLFFAEHKPYEIGRTKGNLLMLGGASLMFETLIGNGTNTGSGNLQVLNGTYGQVGVGDGGPTAISGTIGVTNSSTTITFGTSQSGLINNYVQITGDSTYGLYKVASGSGTSWVLATAYAGSTNASAAGFLVTGEVVTQTDLQASSNKLRNPLDGGFPAHTDGTTTKTITAATNATPIVITSTAHGYSTNDYIQVYGVYGNAAANGLWQITVVDANTYSLNGSVGTGAWTAGGLSSKNGILTVQSTFGTGSANYWWNEFSLHALASGGRMLNRKVSVLGFKTSNASWAFTVRIGLS